MDQNSCSILFIEDNRNMAQMVKLKVNQSPGEIWKQFKLQECHPRCVYQNYNG